MKRKAVEAIGVDVVERGANRPPVIYLDLEVAGENYREIDMPFRLDLPTARCLAGRIRAALRDIERERKMLMAGSEKDLMTRKEEVERTCQRIAGKILAFIVDEQLCDASDEGIAWSEEAQGEIAALLRRWVRVP